jgi:hypothetical protein
MRRFGDEKCRAIAKEISKLLKMPGPDGIITVYGSFRKATECEDGEAAFAEAVFFGEEFKEIHASKDPTEMPASKQEVFASPPTF